MLEYLVDFVVGRALMRYLMIRDRIVLVLRQMQILQ